VSGNDHAAIIRAALDYYERVHPFGPRGATAGDALTALDALVARLDTAEKVLRETGEFAASHSGSDGQPVLLAALYRIADEADAALAGSGETGEQGNA
jgi:hypothetical protein